MNRRNFLKGVVPLGVAPFVLNGIPVQTMANSLMAQASCQDVQERILVLIQMHGGNDGLNTVIPIDQYGAYRAYRPTVGIPETGTGSYLPLTTDNGLHPEMSGIKDLFDNGWANIIQDVGYDNVDRSHFKGNDLWLTGGDSTAAGQTIGSGWVGRYLNNRFPNYPSAYPNINMPDPLGLEFGSRSISLGFHRNEGAPAGLTVPNDPTDFYNLISGVGGQLPTTFPTSHYGEMLKYLTDTQSSANSYATRLNDAYNLGQNSSTVTYPLTYHKAAQYYYYNELAPQLKTVARLIDGGLQTKVYLVRITGFDTHTNQVQGGASYEGQHAVLMYHLSAAVKAFFDDLQARGHADRVMATTFSEFGRQIGENGSLGTDHGTLAPMMLFGKHVNPGVTGNTPDLSAVSNNILHNKQYDYRQVYTTLLQDWMGAGDSSLVDTQFDAWKTQKLSLINPNEIAPPTCYAQAFPVGLTYFDALVEDGNTVRLNWQTATETNNDFFDVQRSPDGAVFEQLDRVQGAGDSQVTQTYTLVDENPFPGVSYYRLKQVDLDGTFVYHDVIKVRIEKGNTPDIKVQTYPNPASDILKISLNARETTDAKLGFYALDGSSVLQMDFPIQVGKNQKVLDVSRLSPGMYHVEINTGRRGAFDSQQLASFKQVIVR